MKASEEEIELIDYLRVTWKWRWLIIGGTLLCMLVALGISLLMPKVYETSLNIKVGQVWLIPIEDSNSVAELINSEAFLDKARQKVGSDRAAYKMKKGKFVTAKAIDKAPRLIHVVVRGDTPESAVELAKTVADLIIQEHQAWFDELMNEHHGYEKEVESQIETIKKGISELEFTLKGQHTSPEINASAMVLLQSQLEQKQSQLLGYVRELRDVRMNNTSKSRTENTQVVLPPAVPENHVNPKTGLNMVIAGIVGLMAFLMLAFFLEYLKQAGQRERAIGPKSGSAKGSFK